MKDEKRLTAPLLDFDFSLQLHAAKSALPKPPEPPPEPEEPKRVRKMAVKKKAPPPPPPVKEKADWQKVVRSWKTEDEQLDFEGSFDDDGDIRVTVMDAGEDGEDGPEIELAPDLGGLDEVIKILQTIRANMIRLASTKICAEGDTIVEEDDDSEEDDDEDEGDEDGDEEEDEEEEEDVEN